MKDVTVVIPAFGAAATLRRTLDSVRGEAEVIVVLDGPDPQTEAVLSDWGDIEVVRLPGRAGAPAARNQGLARARTDYVMFLDADDHIEGALLASAVAAARAEAADVVFGKYVYEWPNGDRSGAPQAYLRQDMSWKGIVKCWLAGGFTPPCGIVWKTAFVRDLGGWDEGLLKNQDGDLVYRALFENPRIAIATRGSGVYVQHDRPDRISAQYGWGATESQFRVLEKIYVRSGSGLSHWRAELGLAYVRVADIAAKGGFADLEAAARERAVALGCCDGLARPPQGPLRGVYINLDRAVDRREQIEAEVQKLDAPKYRRFAAVEGRELPPRPDVANPAELGCYRSHLEVIRANADYGGWLHVMEDDAQVSRYAAEAIGLITSSADFARYDVIFTNVMFNVSPSVFALLRGMFDGTVDTGPDGEVTWVKSIHAMALANVDFLLATSYLVNPRATERLADLLSEHLETEPFEPIDLVLSKLSRARVLDMACVLPFLTLPRIGATSTILSSPDPLSIPLRVAEAAFYADRDMPQLRAILAQMRQTAASSATSDLLADAYREMLNAT